MKIASFRVRSTDEFPAILSENLDNGLNVFFGPRGSGKSTTHAALTNAIFGNLAGPQPFDLPSQSGTHVSFRAGRQEVSQDSNGPAARRAHQLDQQDLPKLLPWYSLSFDGSDLPRLSSDFSFANTTYASAANSRNSDRIKELAIRRDLLTNEIQELESNSRRATQQLDNEISRLAHHVEVASHRLAELQQRLQVVEQQLSKIEATRQRFDAIASRAEVNSSTLPHQLTEIEGEIQRWQNSIQDVDQRFSELHQNISEPGTDLPPQSELMDNQRACVSVIEQVLHEVHSMMPTSSDADSVCHCERIQSDLEPLLHALQQHIYGICSLLSQQQAAVRQEHWRTELQNILRCRSALNDQLHFLEHQRQQIESATCSAGSNTVEQHVEFCQCSEHAEFHSENTCVWSEQKFAELNGERNRLLEELRLLESHLRGLDERRTALEQERASRISDDALANLRQQLRAVVQQLDQERNNHPIESKPCCDVCERASKHLSRITDGHLAQVKRDDHQTPVRVLTDKQTWISSNSITDAGRDMVRISLSLAGAECNELHGVHLPMLLDEPFAHLGPAETISLIDVLSDFSRSGRQVVVFTENEFAIQQL